MALFNRNKKTGGLMDVIRCDEPSYMIWKWHPSGTQQGNNNRENAIRMGSSLRVKEGEVAVFVYHQEDDTMQDFIEGPYDGIIDTNNLPVLASIIGLVYDGGTPFQAEIYFINCARIIQIKFGVPFFDIFDPRFLDFGIPVAVRGTISFQIKDYREFIKINRLHTFQLEDFQKQIRDVVNRYVKDTVTNIPAKADIPVVQIERKTDQISKILEDGLDTRLNENFGILVSGIDISAIEIDKESSGYRNLMSVTRDVASATVQAETEAKIKDIHDKQRIEAEHYEETLRIQREEEQYSRHKQTQTAHFAAFQTEKQAEVGIAGANALGQMGANGGGNVDLSGNSGGFNPAAMMAGMAVGGVVGQNIAGSMGTMMGGMNQTVNQTIVPPPVPTVQYHVAVNGQAAGPYNIDILSQMTSAGQLTIDSLVWKPGMSGWETAGSIKELESIFVNIPPVPPV